MTSLRTSKDEKIYQEFLKDWVPKCIYCEQELLIQKYKYWILLDNKFPYSAIARTHLMLASKRHIVEQGELTLDEISELYDLLDKLEYDMVIMNKKRNRSVPSHFHFHIIRLL